MLNTRTWSVTTIETKEELAQLLTKYSSFVLCAGFKLGNLLFLNDSTSEDSVLEFAVLLETKEGFLEVESITFGWCTYEQALEHIAGLQSGKYYHPRGVIVLFDDSEDHSCHLCN